MESLLRLNAAIDARSPLAAAVDAAWNDLRTTQVDDECIMLDDGDLFDVQSLDAAA